MISKYSIPPALGGLTALSLGLFVFLRNRKSELKWAFSLLCLSISLWLGSYAVSYSTLNREMAVLCARFACTAVAFVTIFIYHFVVALLDLQQERRILWVGYGVTFGFLVGFGFTNLFLNGVHQYYWGFYSKAGPLHPIYLLVTYAMWFRCFYLLYRALKSRGGSAGQNQIKYSLAAFIIGVPATIDYIPKYGFGFYPFGFVFVLLFALVTGYAIVRHRLMDVNLAITRTAVFMAVYVAVLGVPLAAALAWQTQLEVALGVRWWVWVLLSYAALATAAHYVNMWLQRRAEDRLMAEQRRYQAVLRQASQGMTLIKELDKLLRLIVHLLTRKVRVRHAAIYLWDEQANQFVASASRQWDVKQPPPFPRESPLIEYLYWHRSPVVAGELALQMQGGSRELQPVLAGLKKLDAAVLIPSFVEDKCIGFLLMGEKLSGALYTSDDLQVFQVLASQAALAIENAQFYEELNRTQTDLFQTAKMASLGHMAGGMSHQINNRFHVLTILSGTMKSVMKEMEPGKVNAEQVKKIWEKAIETFSKVEENALRGGEIVKTLLKFSRPAGEYKPVSIKTIVETALDVVQFRVNLGALDLVKEIPEDLPPVKGDLNQLADSCFNLISNANDAIQSKAEKIADKQMELGPQDPRPYKGIISIRARMAKKKTQDEEPAVVLEIKDNGVGMNEEDLENLFVPFFTTKATSQKGTGLGLYVIERIMERHRGSIEAHSARGLGTTFIMRLPIFQEEKKADTHAPDN